VDNFKYNIPLFFKRENYVRTEETNQEFRWH